jgi:hypothetical protein
MDQAALRVENSLSFLRQARKLPNVKNRPHTSVKPAHDDLSEATFYLILSRSTTNTKLTYAAICHVESSKKFTCEFLISL